MAGCHEGAQTERKRWRTISRARASYDRDPERERRTLKRDARRHQAALSLRFVSSDACCYTAPLALRPDTGGELFPGERRSVRGTGATTCRDAIGPRPPCAAR